MNLFMTKLVTALVNAYQKITIGDPLDQKNLMGPLIDQACCDQFVKSNCRSKKQGGKILFGGNVIKRTRIFC